MGADPKLRGTGPQTQGPGSSQASYLPVFWVLNLEEREARTGK